MKKLLPFLFLFFVSTSFATHNMAGDISYEYIGSVSNPYKYKIIIKTYTDWVGPSGTDRCELILNYGGGDTTFIPRVNGLSINCPATADGVLIVGCAGNVRYNIYETTHDFAGPGNYTISVEDPNRSSGICNVPDSENTSFYLQAEIIINPFLGNNSGPVYNEVPVLCDTIGVINYYNPLAFDSEGDSLFYELITPMSNGGYLVGYILPDAVNSFTINNPTGTVVWDKPLWGCTYVFAIRIFEWRKISGTYYLIGHTMQEVYSTTPYVGIHENNQTVSLNIFPNPSNGLTNITIESGLQDQEYQLIVSNSIGQNIKTIYFSNNLAIINENELSAGIYFYSLLTKTEVVNKGKFVILK